MKYFTSVLVVILTHNKKQIRLINSILKSDYPKEKRIILIDNASTDGAQRKSYLYVDDVVDAFLLASRNLSQDHCKCIIWVLRIRLMCSRLLRL